MVMGHKSSESVLHIGDPHDNAKGYAQALALAQARGISASNTITYGDWLEELTSHRTAQLSKRSLQARSDLEAGLAAIDVQGKANTSAHLSNVTKGIYSQKTLDRVLKPHQKAHETAKKVSGFKFGKFNDLNPQATKITGNWDQIEEARACFGDTLHEGKIATLQGGLKVGIASGGGVAPVGKTGVSGGFDTDGPKGERNHTTQLVDLVKEGVQMLTTHVRPFPLKGKHNDLYTIRGQNLLFQLKALGYELPYTFTNGHDHGGFSFKFEKIQDPETGRVIEFDHFAPGVLAIEHNQGAYGTFCISHHRAGDGKISMVEEYRVFNTLEGTQKVVHFANHNINHKDKKVEAKYIQKVVSEEKITDMFAGARNLDDGYKVEEKGIIFDYSEMDANESLEALEITFSNLQLMQEKYEKVVKTAVNQMQNEFINMKGHDHKFSLEDQIEAQTRVLMHLSDWVACEKGFDYAELSGGDDDLDLFFRERMVEAFLGIKMNSANREPTLKSMINIKGKKASEIPFNLAMSSQQQNGLDGVAKNHVWSRYINQLADEDSTLFKGLSADKFEKMLKMYQPLNIKRVEGKELKYGEGFQLLLQCYDQGLLSPEAFSSLDAFEQVKKFDANKVEKDALKKMLGISYDDAHKVDGETIPDELVDSVREKISQGAPVYKDTKGDYVHTKNGGRAYLPESVTQEEGLYDPKSMSDLLGEESVHLFKGGFGNYHALIGDNLMPVDPEIDGFDPKEHDVKPLYDAAQAQQEVRNLHQERILGNQRAQQEAFRRLLEENRQLRENNQGPLPPYNPAASDLS